MKNPLEGFASLQKELSALERRAAVVLLLAVAAIFLASCAPSLSQAELAAQAGATATSAYVERTSLIQAQATEMSPTFDWSAFEPCASGAVIFQSPAAGKKGSAELINRKIIVGIGQNGAQFPLELDQVVAMGHEVTDDPLKMVNTTVDLISPVGAHDAQMNARVLSADIVVKSPDPDAAIVSVITIGEANSMPDRQPVGANVASGAGLEKGEVTYSASIPLAAGVDVLVPTIGTVTGSDGNAVHMEALIGNGEGSAPVINGSSGGGVCMEGSLLAMKTARDGDTSMGDTSTSFDANSNQLLSMFFNMAVSKLQATGQYIIP